MKGKTVALTRPYDQVIETGNLIKQYGGQPYFIPSIEIKPTCNLQVMKDFLFKLQNCQVDYVLFMSVNGIRYLFSCSETLELCSQLKLGLKNAVVIAVGPKTAQELKKYGIIVGLVPEEYSSDGIINCLTQNDLIGKSVYVPRTSGASPNLAERLRTLGANVHELYVYNSVLPRYRDLDKQFLEDLKSGKIDAIIFGSSLSAKNLLEMLHVFVPREKLLQLLNEKLIIVSIGPVTAETLSKLGLDVDVMPNTYLFIDAIKELVHYWKTR